MTGSQVLGRGTTQETTFQSLVNRDNSVLMCREWSQGQRSIDNGCQIQSCLGENMVIKSHGTLSLTILVNRSVEVDTPD